MTSETETVSSLIAESEGRRSEGEYTYIDPTELLTRIAAAHAREVGEFELMREDRDLIMRALRTVIRVHVVDDDFIDKESAVDRITQRCLNDAAMPRVEVLR